MTIFAILSFLFVTSIIYAILLQIASRHIPELYDDHTWITVVIGVGYTILFIWWIYGEKVALNIFLIFAVSGAPIVARSLINDIQKSRKINHLLQNGDNDQDDPESRP